MPIRVPIQPWPKGVWTIQFASGLKLHERGWTSALGRLRPVSPNLAILGNLTTVSTPAGIKEAHRFFRDMSKTWEKIYWIPGVSEYSSYADRYHKPYDMFMLRDKVQEFTSDKVTVMDQTEIYLEKEGIVLLGATGWSPGNVGSFWLTGSNGQRPATMAEIADFQDQDRSWLRSRIAWWRKNHPGARIVVLTHDTPEWKMVSDEARLWLSGSSPDKKNVSGMVTNQTFFCVNDAERENYMPDRCTSIPICLR